MYGMVLAAICLNSSSLSLAGGREEPEDCMETFYELRDSSTVISHTTLHSLDGLFW